MEAGTESIRKIKGREKVTEKKRSTLIVIKGVVK